MRTLIRTGTLIDGTGAPPLPDGALIVEEREIVAVGRFADLQAAGMRQIDLRPYTVLPGLIDAHVHIFGDAAPLSLWRTQGQTDAQLAIQSSANAQSALAAGLTTVRDCGGRATVVRALAQAVDEGITPGPRIVHSGTPITTTGGHCHFFGFEAQGVTDVQRAVRHLHKTGIDFVKVMVTGGDLTPGSNTRAAQYSQAELSAVADDAHRLGYRIAGHAHGTEGIRRAVRAGFDTIEHCSWLARDVRPERDYVPALADEIAERGIHVCRTMSGIERLSWEEAGQEHRLWPDYEVFRKMVRAGVKLIAGTDAGVHHTPLSGFCHTLETMAGLGGMTPQAILASATRLAAEALGLQGEIGTLAVGKHADLIAIDGDPLEDLRALRQVKAVMRQGRIVAREGQIVRGPEHSPTRTS